MTELMRNFAMLLLLSCAANNDAIANETPSIQEENTPTIVIGKATEPNGENNEVILVQPDNNENPLGDPLPDIDSQPSAEPQPDMIKIPPKPQQINSASNPKSTEELGQQFQNTLMESNGMVYDVQAYPKADIKAIGNPSNPATIYSPNVNP